MIRIVILLILLLPISMLGQKTYIPDDAFEQALINYGFDDVFDDSVSTASIDTVQILYLDNEGISDLTGIEDFTALSELFCYENEIQHLDLSNNPNLFEVNCRYNQLISLSVKNGNPMGLWYFRADGNPDLLCVEVDNVAHANYYWVIDNTAVFSTNCNPSSVNNIEGEKRLLKIVDLFGKEVTRRTNQPVFYIYDDGTVEKRIVIE